MSDRTHQLRDSIRRHRGRGRGRAGRFPRELRLEAVRHVREHRARGGSVAAIAAQLGLSVQTLYVWLRSDRHGFRSVDVVPPILPPPVQRVLISPGGYRIEGLALDDVAALLKIVG